MSAARNNMAKVCCEPLEVVITSLGPQDDDLRVRVNSTTVFDPRCNIGWYKGEVADLGNPGFNSGWATGGFRVARITREMMARVGCKIGVGSRISVDVFDGWGPGWRTSRWRADVRWEGGRVSTLYGGQDATGLSGVPLAERTDVSEIDVAAMFPRREDVPTGGLYGEQTLGPFPNDAQIFSNAIGIDDDFVVNGGVVGYAGTSHVLFGGALTWLLDLPAGDTFTVDVQNTAGSSCWAIEGSIRVVQTVPIPEDYTTPARFARYIANGGFEVPCP